MLETLRIKNIAIIDLAEIHFKPGLNILSGETGAGKSIVIEAISLLLGSRASTELIRAGCDEAVIEGLFCIGDVPWMGARLRQYGFDGATSELLIKRTVHKAGRHRISINGELANLSVLQNLCEGLIDLCGQHEHQTLLKPTTQLELLDRYGGLLDQTKHIGQLLKNFQTLRHERDQLQQADTERTKRTHFLKFQIDEIQAAQLIPDEDKQLQHEKILLQSAEGRVQTAESARQVIESDDDSGVLNSLRIALQKLRGLVALDERVQVITEALERAVAETEEVTLALNRYVSGVELDPERLQTIQERLSLFADLRRKYGSSITEILETLNKLESEFSSLGQVTEKLEQVSAKLEASEVELKKLGKKLSTMRKKVSEALAISVTEELKDLKMGEAKFLIELSPKESITDWTAQGGDTIQFVVQTNRGEPARPLGRIASGGELSRLMLAIRRVISDRGGIGVYLFDEIDAGIGGQTAFQVGKKLKSVSSYNQVICITHLPQVASFADHHLVVKKSNHGTRTKTEVAELTRHERREELARMLGGPELTQKSLENASELLDLAAGLA
jgi:DNA repair protein RecN (Recombination protein N)